MQKYWSLSFQASGQEHSVVMNWPQQELHILTPATNLHGVDGTRFQQVFELSVFGIAVQVMNSSEILQCHRPFSQ